jgi:hypothetical protein
MQHRERDPEGRRGQRSHQIAVPTLPLPRLTDQLGNRLRRAARVLDSGQQGAPSGTDLLGEPAREKCPHRGRINLHPLRHLRPDGFAESHDEGVVEAVTKTGHVNNLTQGAGVRLIA